MTECGHCLSEEHVRDIESEDEDRRKHHFCKKCDYVSLYGGGWQPLESSKVLDSVREKIEEAGYV